ncbi:zinc-ribbon domain-containing protein [Methanobrevibacter sp. YE315]|uniref:zinc-ribbon domain-containing protein n=1 Tax=Methanobrevibacter sp. YE315 TaxID=1609968 RepID=UPI000B0359B6|nr:zinc-ribbon domain-containing protein [Methanobrevibacter sp. YE315]
MKICPSCRSVLADNEPYCENCGYDPDFDGGSWLPDNTSLKMSYYHGERIK